MARRKKSKPMSDINVVPYIDVMLVLLVIFMVTAPLLVQRVDVDLPVKDADPLMASDAPPIVISVLKSGVYNVYEGDDPQATDLAGAVLRVVSLQKMESDKGSVPRPVLVQGDSAVEYGTVINLMQELGRHNVAGVSLVTFASSGGG